jgi:transglutaminase-like putative cysteine protease
MNTVKIAAMRRVGIAALLVSGWLVAAPAFAAGPTCNGSPRARIDPLS